jgi:hypothetical protein
VSPTDVSPSPAARSGRAGPQAAIEFRHTTLLVTVALLLGVILGAFINPGPKVLVAATGIAMVVVFVVAAFVGKRIRETMGAFRFTATLLIALAILAILGTLILQGKPPELYHARYGPVAGLILALRFDDIFHGLPFALLMALFFVAILFSAALRWPIRKKGIGFFFVHLGLLLSLAGAAASSTLSIHGRINLHTGGEVATHVAVTRGGEWSGKLEPLGFNLLLEKFELINYESEYRIGYYELRDVVDEDGHSGRQLRHKTSFEPDLKRHLLPGGATFQIEGIYPDYVQTVTATAAPSGPPAIQVTAGGRTTWLSPGDEPILAAPGVAVVVDAEPRPVEDAATSVLVSLSTRKVTIARADGQSTQPLAEGLSLLGGAVKIGPFLPSATRTAGHGTASDAWRNPAIRIVVTQGARRTERLLFSSQRQPILLDSGGVLFFEKRPEEAKSYLSTVVASRGSDRVKAVVSVNDPLAFGNWTLYQANYSKDDPTYSGLDAVYDPGVAWVFTGFALISFGVFFVFYVKPFLVRDPRKSSQPAA